MYEAVNDFILKYTDVEGGGEIVKATFRRDPSAFPQAEGITGVTSVASLGKGFHTLSHLEKLLGVVVSAEDVDGFGKSHFPDQPQKLLLTEGVFLGGEDVGVVKKQGNLEQGGEVFQYVGGAGGTAGVQQQTGTVAVRTALSDGFL